MTDGGAALSEALYPRVSTILRDMGLCKPYPEGVPAVEWGRARGTAVHAAIHFYERGLLDPPGLHPDVAGPFAAYLAFKKDTGYEPEAVEEAVVHRGLRYRGTLDSRGEYAGNQAILDFKCSKQPDLEAAAYQLAAYSSAWTATAYPSGIYDDDPAPHRRYVVQLGEESYRVYDVTSGEAASIFEGAVRVWWATHGGERLKLP
jgi:hypothetical protein